MDSRSSVWNHTRSQSKPDKVYTLSQTKTAQRPYPLGRHIPTWLFNIREYPPPPPGLYQWQVTNIGDEYDQFNEKRGYPHFTMTTKMTVYWNTSQNSLSVPILAVLPNRRCFCHVLWQDRSESRSWGHAGKITLSLLLIYISLFNNDKLVINTMAA